MSEDRPKFGRLRDNPGDKVGNTDPRRRGLGKTIEQKTGKPVMGQDVPESVFKRIFGRS